MGPLRSLLSYDDRGALLKYWADAGVHFEIKGNTLVVLCESGPSTLKYALGDLRERLPELQEEVAYQRWAEQSLQERGMDLEHLEFVRYLYQEGRLQS